MPCFRLLAVAVLALALCACKPDAEAPAVAGADKAPAAPRGPATLDVDPAEAPADAAPPPLALGDFRIVSVLIGNAVDADKVVLADHREFTGRQTIHASVLSIGAHQGLRLSAKWLAPDGSTVSESSQPVVPTAATSTTFSINNPAPWPPGDYQLLIAINGQAQRTESFRVR